MKLTFRNDNFVFEDLGLAQAKELFSSPEANEWTAINPDDYATTSLKAAARFRRYADEIAEKIFKRVLLTHYKVPSPPLPPFLDSHQIDGVRWILSRSRSYLAHAPGAGKTAQAIVAATLAEGRGQTVFIVPPSLTVNWAREIMKWTEWAGIFPTISIVPLSTRKADIAWRSHFIIVPDSMLTREWVYDGLLALNIKFIAVDEASRFKEAGAARTNALFARLFRKAKYCTLLDGSPMPNRPMELWAPTFAMDPEAIDFMGQHEFGVRYCGGKYVDNGYKQSWEYKGASHQEELRARLQKNFMHVVTEDKLNHPERLRSLLLLSKDPRSREMKAWEQTNLSKINLADIDEDASQGDVASYRRELGMAKVEGAVEYIKERIEGKNESILLFAWHRDVCTELHLRLRKYNAQLVMGGTTASDRERIFLEFNNGTGGPIVGNISAMGRGHNLQRARRVVFVEYAWNDELNKQCEKRASRKGNTALTVPCDYLVVPNSMDEVVLNAVFTKAKNVKRIIG